MVVKSRDPLFKIPETTQNCSSKLNSTEHVWILVSATNLRSLSLVQHFPSLDFFFSVTSLRAARSEWSSQSLTGWSVIHLRTQAATISLQESLYPLLPSMLSVYWQVPRKQPSRTPAPLWRRGTTPAELWVASDNSVPPKNREKRCTISTEKFERASEIWEMLAAV